MGTNYRGLLLILLAGICLACESSPSVLVDAADQVDVMVGEHLAAEDETTPPGDEPSSEPEPNPPVAEPAAAEPDDQPHEAALCESAFACVKKDIDPSGVCQTVLDHAACPPPSHICMESRCDEFQGCIETHRENGTICPLENLCLLGGGECHDGSCEPSGSDSVVCDDNNPYTTDACDPNSGNCTFAFTDGDPCADAEPCGTHVWNNGSCTFVPLFDGTPCADSADPCIEYACAAGVCSTTLLDGPATGCDTAEQCETTSCVAGSCIHEQLCTPCQTAADCPLDNCVDYTCDFGPVGSSGVCVGSSKICEADGNPCTVSTCDPTQGCVSTNVTDDLPCGETTPCTQRVCQQGICEEQPAFVGQVCATSEASCTAHICQNDGSCQAVPTPGAPCIGEEVWSTHVCSADGACVPNGPLSGVQALSPEELNAHYVFVDESPLTPIVAHSVEAEDGTLETQGDISCLGDSCFACNRTGPLTLNLTDPTNPTQWTHGVLGDWPEELAFHNSCHGVIAYQLPAGEKRLILISRDMLILADPPQLHGFIRVYEYWEDPAYGKMVIEGTPLLEKTSNEAGVPANYLQVVQYEDTFFILNKGHPTLRLTKEGIEDSEEPTLLTGFLQPNELRFNTTLFAASTDDAIVVGDAKMLTTGDGSDVPVWTYPVDGTVYSLAFIGETLLLAGRSGAIDVFWVAGAEPTKLGSIPITTYGQKAIPWQMTELESEDDSSRFAVAQGSGVSVFALHPDTNTIGSIPEYTYFHPKGETAHIWMVGVKGPLMLAASWQDLIGFHTPDYLSGDLIEIPKHALAAKANIGNTAVFPPGDETGTPINVSITNHTMFSGSASCTAEIDGGCVSLGENAEGNPVWETDFSVDQAGTLLTLEKTCAGVGGSLLLTCESWETEIPLATSENELVAGMTFDQATPEDADFLNQLNDVLVNAVYVNPDGSQDNAWLPTIEETAPGTLIAFVGQNGL